MENKTALVIDDSKSARFALRKFLEGKGYAVDTADGANEAFVYLKRKKPSVVFLDHMMPGIDGFDALRTIRLEPELSNLPIIICSSNEGDAFVREARAQGATDVLPKPPNQIHIDTVLARVEAGASAPPPPPKVQPIREPEVIIERAVMKTMREAMPEAMRNLAAPPAPAAAPPSVTPMQAQPQPRIAAAAPAAPVAGPAPAVVPAAAPSTGPASVMPPPRATTPPIAARPAVEPVFAEQMRTEMETRLRRITQDLYVQMGELKAQFAVVDDELRAHSEERARTFAQEAAQGQAETLAVNVDKALSELRADFETVLSQHNHRIDEQHRLIELQNQQIEQLTRTLEAQSRAMEERNTQVDNLLRAMEEQSNRIDSISSLLEEQGGRNETLAKMLEEQNQRTEAMAHSLQDQHARLEPMLQAMRESAAQEAHNVAERVVMNAAKRISDQMAESFLRVLQQPVQQPVQQSMAG
jgi:CheY-like chemotaxis protein